MLGTLGFDLWYFKGRKVVNMGGSQVQAEIVYGYFKDYTEIGTNKDIENETGKATGVGAFIKGDATRNRTDSVGGNYFSCVTASQKQVRGKHPDVLLSDETAETDDDVVYAALPIVNSSANPLVVMASTFHQIFGVFQEVWDNADQLGYARFQWDIFDVAKQFSADVWERPEFKAIYDIEKLKELAKGRTGDPDGWIPIENIIQAWREKPTLDWFLVEYMGDRPSASGLVLKPEDVDRAVIAENEQEGYNVVVGAQRIIGIDWGFSGMTSVTDFMKHKDDVKVLIHNENYTQVPSEDIIKDVVELVRAGGHKYIYADSEAKFENVALQNALRKAELPCKVIEVVFGKEKPEMLGNLRAHFEQGKIRIPKKYREAYKQYKNYRYQEGTDKPMKKNDHIPDSTMCALQHGGWQLHKQARQLSEQPADKTNRTITRGLLDERF